MLWLIDRSISTTKRGSISSRIASIPKKLFTDKSLKQNCFSIKEHVSEEHACTAEFLHSEEGNTDFTEVIVIDEMTRCKVCKERGANGKSCCTCRIILQELPAEQTQSLKETTVQVMIRVSSFAWAKIGTGRLTRHLGQGQEYQVAKHHFRKSSHNCEGFAERWCICRLSFV